MSIVIMILLLSFLILVHEMGHFLAAKAFGIKVDKFGFGLPFGPTLFEKKFGETTFVVHALLLGGYVAFPDDDKNSELPEDSSERFENKPVYQRAIVVSAGVIANVLCAFFLVLFSALVWHHLPSGSYDVIIDKIVAPKTSPVWESGVKEGDKIVSVNGVKITNAGTLLSIMRLSKTRDGLVDKNIVEQNYEKIKKLNPALARNEIIPSDVAVRLPLDYVKEAVIVLDKRTAMGVKKYKDNQIKLPDRIIKLRDYLVENTGNKYFISNGNYTLEDLAYAISDNVHPVKTIVERNGELINLKEIYTTPKGTIGVQLKSKEVLKPTKSVISAIASSSAYLYENTSMLVSGLGQVFTGKVPLKDLHGIVAITKVGGDIIDNNGLFYGILLAAIISMDLAIVNFLPIPALDGGQLLFLIIEKVAGKKVGAKVLETLATVSFILLLGLMIVVVFNDIWALITKQL